MKFRKYAGIAIILLGAAIFLYPFFSEQYAKQQNKLLREEFDAILAQAETRKEDTKEQQQEIDSSQEGSDLGQAFSDLELKEEEVEETAENESQKDRLHGQKVIGLIEIEAIDIIYAVVEGTEDGNIGVAIGHLKDTAKIGAYGNCVLAGHRGGITGPYFKDVDKLIEGDIIKLTATDGTIYNYKVTESFIVDPEDVWVAEDLGTKTQTLTLVTCENNGNRRLIVRAEVN